MNPNQTSLLEPAAHARRTDPATSHLAASSVRVSNRSKDAVRACFISDCGEPVLARGLCSRHWQRWSRYGSADAPYRNLWIYKLSEKERFWAWVDTNEECWKWLGTKDAKGYGKFGSRRAHRCAYEFHTGSLPKNLQLHHLCGNKACVRPDHLEPMMPGEHSRLHHVRTHCKRGHELTPENTYSYIINGRVARTCRQCALDRVVWRRARIKAVAS